jgi:hypothetical protein
LSEPAPLDSDEPPSILSQLKTKKKSAPGALAGASEGAVSAPMGPSEVEEVVSLVLVRQVPPRFDEEPRNWLGGLPMMPTTSNGRARLPRTARRGRSAASLRRANILRRFPEDLWGGVGPRTGWLLLFLNPHDSQGDDPRLFRVIHTSELGSERQPPEDLRPVESEESGDSEYRWCATADAIPRPGGAGRSTSSRSQRGPRQRLPDDRHAPEFLRQALRRRTGRIRRPDVTGMEPFSGAARFMSSIQCFANLASRRRQAALLRRSAKCSTIPLRRLARARASGA